MASDSLSQSEIDALFGTGGSPRTSGRSSASGELRRYDFQRPSRISKEQARTLRAIYGLVTKGLEGWMAGRIRESVSLELENVEPLSFGEFTLALPSPCAAYILSLSETEASPAVIEMGREFAFFLVDRLLGGAGELDVPDRSLTLVERAVLQVVVERLAQQLQEAWQDYVPMDPRVVGFEAIPEMLQVTNAEDPVLVAHVKVTVEEVSSLLLICLPFPALEKFLSGGTGRKLSTARGTPEERKKERLHLAEHIRRAGLTVSAHFPAFNVPLGVLSELKVGEFLSTGLNPETELEVRVANLPRYGARAGREGDQRAVLISHRRGGGAGPSHP
ncbi:MAG: flagellar motor switch protein FliM [Gemmatimonadales bacterium]|nr:MAG: flagellar motor switch protein FliM [Gemmatimonadales bacterium]